MKKYLSIMALFLIIILFPSCAQLNTSICDECGSHSLGNKNFCSECGANLYKVETQETTQEIFQETAESEAIEVTKEVTSEVTQEITQEITQEVTQETTYETIEERTESSKLSAVEIYDSTSPSVVAITAISTYSTSSGTGFFYSESIIVTNYHVIEGCSSAYVTLQNGEKYTVINVVGYDQVNDIAMLQIEYSKGTPIPIRKDEIKTGEKVYAIGNSLGFLDGSLSEGIISTAQRELNENVYIQTTAPVTHGNSGGPLLDEYGQVIGIVCAGLGDGLNLNLAIPVEKIEKINTSNPLTMKDLNLANSYNVLYNFIKNNGTESITGSIMYSFKDKNGKSVLNLTVPKKSDHIFIVYYVMDIDVFYFEVTIYPDRTTCEIAATLVDRITITVRGRTSDEVEKSRVFTLNPASEFEYLYRDEKYYATWLNYYNSYLDDLFLVYDYCITQIAGLSCDSTALGFTYEN